MKLSKTLVLVVLDMKKILNLSLFFALAFEQQIVLGNNWYGQKNRGWYFFETFTKEDKDQTEKKLPQTAQEAQEYIAKLQKKERGLHSLMILNPTEENIRNYQKTLLEVTSYLTPLAENWQLFNFSNHELHDTAKNPSNISAFKVYNEVQKKVQRQDIELLAKDYGLVLFRKSDCQFCEHFEPILQYFSQEYGFEVEAVNLDSSESKFFRSKYAPQLASILNVEATPMVFLVSNKGQGMIEFSRGFLNLEELEKNGRLAVQFLKTNKQY